MKTGRKQSEDAGEGHVGGFRASVPRFATAGVLLLATGGLMLLFSQAGGAFFPAYRVFSKTLMGGISAVTGMVPFALWDWMSIPLAVAAVATLVMALVRTRSLWRWVSTMCVIVASLLFFLVGAWGLNHYAPPLSEDLGLDVGEYSADELTEATGRYLGQAAALAVQVPRNDDYSLEHQDFYELARICGASYGRLGEAYPVFQGSGAPVKALLLAGEPLLYWGNTGIFWPYTAECNVPPNCADANIAFTMCHEAAHRLGIASEQEANFAAFLACADSDDVRVRYSGYLEAFGYCYNALAANYPSHAQDLITSMVGEEPDLSDPRVFGIALVFTDRQAAYQHYRAYDGPVEEVGTAANDTFLKAFDEEEGVKSYGLVVDYLLAWDKAERS